MYKSLNEFEIQPDATTGFHGNRKGYSGRLHCTIRFSIDDNVNILSPNSKTIHTKFTKPASF